VNKELIEKILKFRDERNWKQFHNPKDLAISINLEAAELLENFQWTGSDTEVSAEKLENVSEELADVVIYCIYMADVLGLDMDTMILNKLSKNGEKYKVNNSYENKNKYTRLEVLS
jgi:NTP pyrophosphatase (non-canonical NTP hydrolase)